MHVVYVIAVSHLQISCSALQYIIPSNGFRSSPNRDLTGDQPTFVDSSVGSVWIWRYPIDSPVTASVGPKKQSVDVGSRSWSDRSGRSSLSQISEKSRSGTRASQDRPGFYYVDVTHGAVTGKWYISN